MAPEELAKSNPHTRDLKKDHPCFKGVFSLFLCVTIVTITYPHITSRVMVHSSHERIEYICRYVQEMRGSKLGELTDEMAGH